MGSYEQAVTALYRAPHESFVSERRRLAGELKTEGDKPGAAQLAKLGRPPISAWAVNQLWWHARDAFDDLFETAAQLRAGKLSASTAHRKAILKLAARAQQLLSEAGHSANDATLRRVTMTLSSLAAAGGFEPDMPGTLTNDREPPGFEAFGIGSSDNEPIESKPAVHQKSADHAPPHAAKGNGTAAERKREAGAAAAERKREAEAAAAERKREAEALAKRQARRKKLDSEVRDAKAALVEREHERDGLAKQLATAEREVERARAAVEAAQSALETVED
jgi:hypothetical protein